MSGNLYQLTSPSKNLPPGYCPFVINGPHDTYGYVIKRLEERKSESLYLIRGIGHQRRSIP